MYFAKKMNLNLPELLQNKCNCMQLGIVLPAQCYVTTTSSGKVHVCHCASMCMLCELTMHFFCSWINIAVNLNYSGS